MIWNQHLFVLFGTQGGEVVLYELDIDEVNIEYLLPDEFFHNKVGLVIAGEHHAGALQEILRLVIIQLQADGAGEGGILSWHHFRMGPQTGESGAHQV